MRFSVAVFALLIFLTYVYLYPGSEALFAGRTDAVMSDGTDPTTLPYAYDRVVQIWKNHPSHLFYGAIYEPSGDGDRGTSMWIPWLERWSVVLGSYFLPVEQISTFFIFTLLVLNGFCMWMLCRYLKWHPLIAFAMAAAWAFNPYTRARAKVHGALAGTYHLPLIFLGLFLVARGKSWRSLAAAAACFLFAATTAHYYLVTSIFVSPFFLGFLLLQPEFKANARRVAKRMAIAVLPALLFLAANRWVPLPPGAGMTESQAVAREWLNADNESPFLAVFRAFPLDYLGGDISLPDPVELNPVRSWVNGAILSDLGRSNPHERTNGIRWIVFLAAIWCLFQVSRGKLKDKTVTRPIYFFLAFAFFTFWVSMGPEVPSRHLSPTYWLYNLVPNMRVASRAAINVHFSLLMIAGFFFATRPGRKYSRYVPALFLALVLLDYPPLSRMPMAQILPAHASLQRDKGPCGLGMFFPYVNGWATPGEFYVEIQKMRGSDCPILNHNSDPKKVQTLMNRFPPSGEYLARLPMDPSSSGDLERLATCLPLNWIVFHPVTPSEWVQTTCAKLGWTLESDLTCHAPQKDRPQQNPVAKCL